MTASVRSIHVLRNLTLIGALLMLWLPAVGQTADSIQGYQSLPEVIVSSQPELPPTSIRQLVFKDSILRASGYTSVAQLLGNEADVYIRSYGPGSSATVSLRGASSSQTSFSWNGIPIVHGMLGLQDLSVLPVRMFDGLSVEYGGTSAHSGNGSIGGSVSLQNSGRPVNGISGEIETLLGSFGRYDQYGSISFGFDRFALRTRVMHARADNDFPFRPTEQSPEQNLANAEFSQTGIMQEVFYSPAQNHQISGRVWWQKTDRQIPPTTVQNFSNASQLDKSLRTQLGWNTWRGNWKWDVTLSYLQDSIVYRDPTIRLLSPSKSSQFYVNGKGTWSIDRSYALTGGITHMFLNGSAESYDMGQHRTSINLSYNYFKRKIGFNLDLRQELVDGQFAPFSYATGLEWLPAEWVSIKGKISRDYRLPGLNDLFWAPGGNPDLKAEKSFGQELGIKSHLLTTRTLMISLTGFNRYVDNWILWSIAPGESFWSAKNIAEVHSRGIEATISWKGNIGPVGLSPRLQYSLTRSTNEVEIELPMTAPGTQLVYTPLHSMHAGAALNIRGLSIDYLHNITGEVRIGPNQYLEGYHTGRIELRFKQDFSTVNVEPFIIIDNIWNEQYRVIQYRPMPGRNYAFGLNVRFQ